MGGRKSKEDGDDDEHETEEAYSFKPFVYEIQVPEEMEEAPYPRSGHRIVCDEANFYSYGGYNPDFIPQRPEDGSDNESNDEQPGSSLFPDVWKYNFACMKWRKLPVRGIPNALASNAILLSGKLLMVYGGTGVPFHIARSNDLYVCNLAASDLRFKKVETTGRAPLALYGQAVFMKDNYFYTVGGTTGFEYFFDIHRLNFLTNVWEEVYIYKGGRNEPPGRYRHELVVINDKIYVLGGSTSSDAYDFVQIPVFDLKQNTWDVLLSVQDSVHGYPSPRQFHSAVKIPGENGVVMAGGVIGDQVLDDAWRIDIPSMQWTKICSLRLCTPVYFHSSSVTPAGKMFTFGGVSKTVNQERVSHVQSAWICIPKLKEICWEAIVDYGLIDEFSSEAEKNGLPMEYLNRLNL